LLSRPVETEVDDAVRDTPAQRTRSPTCERRLRC